MIGIPPDLLEKIDDIVGLRALGCSILLYEWKEGRKREEDEEGSYISSQRPTS